MSVKSILRGLKSTYLDNESVTIKEQLGYAGGIFGNAMGQDSTDTFADKFNRNFMGLSPNMLILKGNISTILGFFIPPLAGTLYDMPAVGKRSHLRTALMIAPVPFAITSMLMFVVPTGSSLYNFIWTMFFSLFFSIADTFFDIALNTLGLKMVRNPPDRKKFFTFESIASTLGSMLPGGVIPVLVGLTDDASRQKWTYFFIALGFCIIGVAAMYAPYMTISERAAFYAPNEEGRKEAEKYKFDKRNLTAIIHNRPFVVLQLANFFEVIRQITYKILPFFYEDTLDAYSLQTIVGTISGAISYVGLMAVPFVGKKVSARGMLVGGYSYTAFFYAIISSFNFGFSVEKIRKKKWIIGACIALAGMPNAAQGAARKIITADSTDYMEWYSEKRFGIPLRSDGMLSASQNILGKFNLLVKENLYNILFKVIKYKSNELKDGSKPVQTDSTLLGIYMITTVCGLLGNLLPALSFLLDNYSGKRKDKIYAELIEMRKAREIISEEFEND
ncbi:MAG: MFS transporter [Clostridia bacterium]|nr:MFS transporter [Clostridia bacterium]